MSAGNYATSNPGKVSSDSGQKVALDRWSQRRLQRLNTEQGFREQRQGGAQAAATPVGGEQQQQQPTSSHSSRSYSTSSASYIGVTDAQPPPSLPTAPSHAVQQQTSGYQAPRAAQPNAGLNNNIQTQPAINPPARPSQYQQQDPNSAYSPTELPAKESSRPGLATTRSFTQQSATADESMSMSNNGARPAPTTARVPTNGTPRQSLNNGVLGSHAQGQAAGYAVGQNYKAEQGQIQQQQGAVGRATPQPGQAGEDMNEEEITQLVKDHKELRECGWLQNLIDTTNISQAKSTQRSKNTTSKRRTR
jgi:hypothetical protein